MQNIVPEGTKHTDMIFLMSESTVQFDFYSHCSDGDLCDRYLGSKAFKIKVVLEEEIPCEE